MKKTIFIWASIVLIAGLTIYNTFSLGKVKTQQEEAVVLQPVNEVITQPQSPPIINPKIATLGLTDYSYNLDITNKLHLTPISSVNNTYLSADIGDIWNDAINEVLRYKDGNTVNGDIFMFRRFDSPHMIDGGIYTDTVTADVFIGGAITVTGATNLYLKTITATSANLLAGDSLMIKTGEAGVLPIAIRVYYDYATAAYTTAASDSTCIYTYSNSVPTKIAYMADAILAKTHDDYSSVGLDIISYSNTQPFWINLKNYDTGGGTLRVDFIYVKL